MTPTISTQHVMTDQWEISLLVQETQGETWVAPLGSPLMTRTEQSPWIRMPSVWRVIEVP